MTDRSRLRIMVLGVLVISLVATLVGRLWYLQVIAAPQFRTEALQSQVRNIVTEAPRGEIVDDKGRPWVTNKTAVVITVDRAKLAEQPHNGRAVVKRLAALLGKPFRLLRQETTGCTYKKVTVTVHHKPVQEEVGSPAHCYNGDPSQPVAVSEAKPTIAATKRAIQIEEMQEDFPGIAAKTAAVRQYPRPEGADASTILGYTQPISAAELKALPGNEQAVSANSTVGVTGLEQYYNSYLKGTPGDKQITVNAVGSQTGVVKNTQPKQGDDLVTYLDAKAQATLETQVQDAITYTRDHQHDAGDYAAGVVLNARNGGVVAMASEPTYNPNKPPPAYKSTHKFNQFQNSEGLPFIDKAYGSGSPPGSTFKPVSASGLMADGTLSKTDPAGDCPSTYQNRTNFEGESGKGYISLHEAIVISCDTFFFELGDTDWKRDAQLVAQHKQPREGVQHMARAYGFGENPKVDLPNANYGHIADRFNTKADWQQLKGAYCQGAKNSSFSALHRELDRNYCHVGDIFLPGDQENEDVGQGTVLVSPLQLATAYAAIANGGTVFEPRVVKAIVNPAGRLVKRVQAPVRDHIALPASSLAYLRSALYGVTHESGGTAEGLFAGFPFSQVDVGGKTGTAELPNTSENGSWFASFGGPTGQSPQYVTVIEVHKSDQGATSAAPFVKNMWDALYGLQGQTAIFKNGVPPTRLPKVGAAALKLQQQRAQRHQQQPTSGAGSSPSPTSTTTSSTNADGLPPALEPERRGRTL